MRKLTLFLCMGLFAALSAPAYSTEVAVLDWRGALLSSDAAQRSMQQLESRLAGQQQEAQSLGQELSQLQQRLQQEGDSLPDDQRRSLIQEFQQKGSRFEQLRQQIMEEQMRAEQNFLQEAEPKLERAVEQVISRHNVQVLVEPQGVLHSERDLPNLTGEVIEILNSLN
ncbi:OmpH family outer membrane protein [Billgrantia desiderata]|uniref:OmpH family outer membrane protein n=1 Tax=Billgrantia desiderata TaxID=52021 RepID=A0AAW4YP10_9GAMM|nr:OmpH family outer membrane protein [Halomonas desiderata]MCE8011071.1 OmpH family outer membrane protein [Halomonas desiderata]MCE8030232.1 OmpH family outer membrane protein [Halomonas desiderata]MCE8042737.1 OmpH family outer membrane protein [Halomonas desiderata]MCE8047312.1 OmpH family outer membrane protein [Halomonas desiderata]MCE8050619.1 OmpH family outer membrane protein [Halomonas desiderata]